MTLTLDLNSLRTPQRALLHPLRLSVAPGCVHTVMGPSGAGKSSLLAALCGTLPEGLHFDGMVYLNGQRIDTLPAHARRVGILFQDALLFPHMTVGDNLLFAVPRGPSAQRRSQMRHALADVEMGAFAQADPATLSGGQRARVALARALLAKPLALLLDEPFARLDVALRERMRALVFGLVQTRQIPALLVTHDLADVTDPAHLTHLLPAA